MLTSSEKDPQLLQVLLLFAMLLELQSLCVFHVPRLQPLRW